MESYVYKLMPVSALSAEFPFACRYRLEDQGLEASVRRRGILQPIVLSAAAPHAVVSGHRRLHAARLAGMSEVPALVLQRDLTPAELYLLSLLSNWKQAWSEFDRAWALRRAVENYGLEKGTVFEEVLPCLGLPAQVHVYEEYLQAARLEKPLLDRMADGKAAFKAAKCFSRFNSADQRTLAALLDCVPLTLNQILKSGEWLFDLLKLSGSSLESFLRRPELSEILEAEHHDGRQAADDFYQAVRKLRFPRLSDRESAFADLSRKIEEGFEEVSVEAPNSFEPEGVTLHARIRNGEALDRVVQGLQNKRKLFNSLLDIVL